MIDIFSNNQLIPVTDLIRKYNNGESPITFSDFEIQYGQKVAKEVNFTFEKDYFAEMTLDHML